MISTIHNSMRREEISWSDREDCGILSGRATLCKHGSANKIRQRRATLGFCYCTIYIPLLLTKKGQGHSVLQHCFHILERERDFTFHKIYSMAMSAPIHLVYEAGQNTTTIYFMHIILLAWQKCNGR